MTAIATSMFVNILSETSGLRPIAFIALDAIQASHIAGAIDPIAIQKPAAITLADSTSI